MHENHEWSSFINIHYSNRALEWINICRLFQELLIFFQFSHMCSLVENIIFAWSYDKNLTSVLYNSAAVFKQFSFVHFLHVDDTCACTSATRLRSFCDPLTITETSKNCKPAVHVRTMNINIIQHKQLRLAVSQGLNHIPLQSIIIAKAVASIIHAYQQLVIILQLKKLQFPIETARLHLHNTYLSILKTSS